MTEVVDIPPPTEEVPVIEAVAAPEEVPVEVALPDTSVDSTAFDFQAPKAKKETSFIPEDTEFVLAKSYLTTKSKNQASLYDHLTQVVMNILETRPQDATEQFETLSNRIKKNRFVVANPAAPTSIKVNVPGSKQVELANQQIGLFTKPNTDDGNEKAAPTEMGELPDIMDLSNLFEWAGVSFGREETFSIFLHIKKLVEEKPLKSVRLWGKIFGTSSNYIIVEGEIRDGATDEDDAIANAVPEVVKDEPAAKAAPAAEGAESPKAPEDDETGIPKPKTKVYLPLGRENRIGVNRYVYYATAYRTFLIRIAGAPWVRLPDVVPEKLQISRKIYKYLTGIPTSKIVSYPPFDGTEAQYLRCAIARISSATVLSPSGYYMIDTEEGEAEEGAVSAAIIINPEFEGLPNDQLVNLTNWVHHVPFILPQGRVTWEHPALQKEAREGAEEDEDEEGEEGADAGGDNVEPEAGPTPLSVITSDEDHGDIPAWSARMCSPLSPSKYSPVALRSNRWPGATVVAYNDKFANIYVGNGLKDLGNPNPNFVPPRLGDIQKEYASEEGGEGNADLLVEQSDPTVEQEKAFEDERKAKEAEGKEASDNGDDVEEEPEEE